MTSYFRHTDRTPLYVVDHERVVIRLYGMKPRKTGDIVGADDQQQVTRQKTSEEMRKLNNTETV